MRAVRQRLKGGLLRQVSASLGFVSLSTAVLAFSNILLLPAAVSLFGAAPFGAWLATQALSAYFANGSGGAPLAVLTRMSAATSERQRAQVLTAGLRQVFALGIALAALTGAVSQWVDWRALLFSGAPVDGLVVSALVYGTLALLPFTVFTSALGGVGRVGEQQAWQASRSIAKTAALAGAIVCHTTLPALAIASVGGETLLMLAVAIRCHRLRLYTIRASLRRSDPTLGRSMLTTGGAFFVVQVQLSLLYASDALLVSAFVGPEAVPLYVSVQRFFGLLLAANGAAQAPLWPIYGKANAEGHTEVMARRFEQATRFTLTANALGYAFIVITYPYLSSRFLGPELEADALLVAAIGVFPFVYAYASSCGVLLSATGRVQDLIRIYGLEMVLKITLSAILLPRFGLLGLGLAAGLAVFLGSTPLLSRRAGRLLHGRAAAHRRTALLFSASLSLLLLLSAAVGEATSLPRLTHAGVMLSLVLSMLYFRQPDAVPTKPGTSCRG